MKKNDLIKLSYVICPFIALILMLIPGSVHIVLNYEGAIKNVFLMYTDKTLFQYADYYALLGLISTIFLIIFIIINAFFVRISFHKVITAGYILPIAFTIIHILNVSDFGYITGFDYAIITFLILGFIMLLPKYFMKTEA